MAKELIWSQDSILLNKTLEDSLDLLFCQDFKKTKNLREQMKSSKGLAGIARFIKDNF